MRRIAVAVVALALGITACQDMDVSPEQMTAPAARFDHSWDHEEESFGNPPPPPVDSGAVGVAEGADQNTYTFELQTRYFLNHVNASGWLTFPSAGGDPNARVRYSQGEFSGVGTLAVPLDQGGLLLLDLSSVTQLGKFGECDSSGCFVLEFEDGTIIQNGNEIDVTSVIIADELSRILTRG